MSSDDFNICSELLSIKRQQFRREQFEAFLKKRFCLENFEVWSKTIDLVDLIRNQALDVTKKRNTLLFDTFNLYIHEGSDTPMNVPMDLKNSLQTMISGLRVDPDGKFDVRLVLELQKEAEVLLVTDVKTFCNEFPFDGEEVVQKSAGTTMEGTLTVASKARENTGEPVRRKGVFSALFSGKDGGFTETKNRVVLEDDGSLKIFGAGTTVLHSLHMSSIVMDVSERKGSGAVGQSGSVGPGALAVPSGFVERRGSTSKGTGSGSQVSPAAPRSRDKKQEGNISFSSGGFLFQFRFKSDEERDLWRSALMLKYEHWRQIKARRKAQRALVLQADIGEETDGVNSFIDNFQGFLRKTGSMDKSLSSGTLGGMLGGGKTPATGQAASAAPTTTAISSVPKPLTVAAPVGGIAGGPPSLQKEGTQLSQSSASIERNSSRKVNPRRLSAAPDSLSSTAPSALKGPDLKGRFGLLQSAPSITRPPRTSMVSVVEDEEEESSDELPAVVSDVRAPSEYKAILFDDFGGGLADPSMYDAVDGGADKGVSPLGQLYGNPSDGAPSPLVALYTQNNRLSVSSPVKAADTSPSSYNNQSYAANKDGNVMYSVASSNMDAPAPASGGPISYGAPPGVGIESPRTSDAPRQVVGLSDSESSEEEPASGDKFVHRDNLYDFNGIFQQKLQELRNLRSAASTISTSQLEACYTAIIRLGEDFVKTALTYGKIIINEKYLPLKHKTIKPSTDMGGVLGGEKYVVHRMLFKFAIDSKGVFRGRDDASAKVAGHELKGLKAYFSVADPDLHFPLMALIDYVRTKTPKVGFRLIAVSMLPLAEGSLIYGSEDAGITVHAKDPRLNELIAVASQRLNLKPHCCGKNNVTVFSPVDLEGHIGTDGRFYLLDFSRVFPPVTPSKEVVGGHLFQYFRGEFVFNFPLFPLCSDAYSRFVLGQPDEKEHQTEIDAATKDLTGITLSNFARDLVTALEEEVRAVGSLKKFRLTEEMHRIGMNMRYLGLLVSRLGKFKYAKFLIAHMCARLIKIQIRARLRARMAELKLAVDEPYRIAVTDYLNLVFGNSSASVDHWNNDIVSGLDQRFSLRPKNWNQFPRNLKEYLWSGLEMKKGAPLFDLRVYLFKQVRQMSGITFSPTLESMIGVANNDFWSQERFCDDTDVLDLGAKVKHVDIMSKARGRVFSLRAEEKQRQGFLGSAKQLFMSALESFETALSGSPLDPDLLRNCALTKLRMILIDERLANPGAPIVLSSTHAGVVRVGRYFVRALQADPGDPSSHMAYAKFLVLCRSFELAEDHFLQSLSLEPNQEKGLLAYAEFLDTVRHQSMDAAIFRSRAHQVRSFLISNKLSQAQRPVLYHVETGMPLADRTVKG